MRGTFFCDEEVLKPFGPTTVVEMLLYVQRVNSVYEVVFSILPYPTMNLFSSRSTNFKSKDYFQVRFLIGTDTRVCTNKLRLNLRKSK